MDSLIRVRKNNFFNLLFRYVLSHRLRRHIYRLVDRNARDILFTCLSGYYDFVSAGKLGSNDRCCSFIFALHFPHHFDEVLFQI